MQYPPKNKFADYIVWLYQHGKQDGLFYVGSESGNHKLLFEQLQFWEIYMFRSEIPIFLPIEHSDVVELRLDNNIIFYQTYDAGKFNLVDKFTVKGGPVITSVMGAFEVCSQFLYQCEKTLVYVRFSIRISYHMHHDEFFRKLLVISSRMSY